MALAQIIDLDEVRRAKKGETSLMPAPIAETPPPMWCVVWMPVYYWYVG